MSIATHVRPSSRVHALPLGPTATAVGVRAPGTQLPPQVPTLNAGALRGTQVSPPSSVTAMSVSPGRTW